MGYEFVQDFVNHMQSKKVEWAFSVNVFSLNNTGLNVNDSLGINLGLNISSINVAIDITVDTGILMSQQQVRKLLEQILPLHLMILMTIISIGMIQMILMMMAT